MRLETETNKDKLTVIRIFFSPFFCEIKEGCRWRDRRNEFISRIQIEIAIFSFQSFALCKTISAIAKEKKMANYERI